VNVAIVPLENADGVATLEELLPAAQTTSFTRRATTPWGGVVRRLFPGAAAVPRGAGQAAPVAALAAAFSSWMPTASQPRVDQPFSGYAPAGSGSSGSAAFVYAIVLSSRSLPTPAMGRQGRFPEPWTGHQRGSRYPKTGRELKDRYVRYARAWEPECFLRRAAGLTVLPSEKRLAGSTSACSASGHGLGDRHRGDRRGRLRPAAGLCARPT